MTTETTVVSVIINSWLIHKFTWTHTGDNKLDNNSYFNGKLTNATSTGGPVTSARPKPTLNPSVNAAISSSVSKNIFTLQSPAIANMHQLREARRWSWQTLYYTCNPQVLMLSEASSANSTFHIYYMHHNTRIERIGEVEMRPVSLCYCTSYHQHRQQTSFHITHLYR